MKLRLARIGPAYTKMKKCTVCKEEKEYSCYHKSKQTKDGFGYRCIACDRLARHSYREENRDRFRKVARKKQLKHKYGISQDDYQSMLALQDGGCAICKTDNPSGQNSESDFMKHFAVDHCHISGRVRGLLCSPCNRALGFFQDSPGILSNALEYLTH